MQLALNLPNPLAACESLFLDHDQPFTTSRAVAERFGKQHKDVLKAIKNIFADCPDPVFSQRNFAPRKYPYKTAKNQCREATEYRITHNGFAILAMGFTGADALAWKIAFLEAFNTLEAELTARTLRYAAALDQIRPCLRPVVEATEQGKSRADIAAPLGKSANSISYHRRSARRLGLLAA